MSASTRRTVACAQLIVATEIQDIGPIAIAPDYPGRTVMRAGRDPFAYLRDVLDRVSTHPQIRIEELLPDRWKPAEITDPSGRKG
jgi:hypothetical protein